MLPLRPKSWLVVRVESVSYKNPKSYKDLTGLRFERLLVVSPATKKGSWTMFNCRCDCGTEITTYSTHLIRGNVKSCGCLRGEQKGSNHVQWKGYGDISGHMWYKIREMNSHGHRRRRHHLTFELTIEYAWELYIKQGKKCALTGLPIGFSAITKEHTASLDRIDNDKGYTDENVQWVHKDINRMKNVYHQNYFIEMCRLVATEGVCEL